jgi:hypothetical protein
MVSFASVHALYGDKPRLSAGEMHASMSSISCGAKENPWRETDKVSL